MNRGLEVTHTDTQLHISGQGFTVSAQFNEQNLMTAMSANLNATQ